MTTSKTRFEEILQSAQAIACAMVRTEDGMGLRSAEVGQRAVHVAKVIWEEVWAAEVEYRKRDQEAQGKT